MKISTALDHVENGTMTLPEFQRGYVWNRATDAKVKLEKDDGVKG